MKWIKQQLTEFTAWAGFMMIIGAFFAPRSAFVIIGILLICIDDKKAKAWCAKVAPGVAAKIEEWMK